MDINKEIDKITLQYYIDIGLPHKVPVPVVPVSMIKDVIIDFGRYMCEQQRNLDYNTCKKDECVDSIKYSKLSIDNYIGENEHD